jgi:hypothetical protein
MPKIQKATVVSGCSVGPPSPSRISLRFVRVTLMIGGGSCSRREK